ncbi:hypothetical protein NT017_09810 [Prolixibacter sp. NT017]|nr:hypothetical protein NT017_09810 [Prolixibacter sp. NT017]
MELGVEKPRFLQQPRSGLNNDIVGLNNSTPSALEIKEIGVPPVSPAVMNGLIPLGILGRCPEQLSGVYGGPLFLGLKPGAIENSMAKNKKLPGFYNPGARLSNL